MKKERKLIFEDETYPAYLEKSLNQFTPLLKKVKTEYEKLELGPFSNEVLKEVLKNGTSIIRALYQKRIEEEIKKMGITISLVKENLIKGTKENFSRFTDAVEELGNFSRSYRPADNRPRLELSSITYTKNGFLISEEERESIIEKHGRIYLSTKEEHELYSNVETFLESFKAINRTLEKVGAGSMDNFGRMSGAFFKVKDGIYELTPQSIPWHITKAEREKKLRDQQLELARD